MFPRLGLTVAVLFTFLPGLVTAQEKVLPPGDPNPLLRLEAGGPTSTVTSLVFSPDNSTLYAAGMDKVVRVWRLNPATRQFELDPAQHYRVPIAPGLQGAINAMAVSSDGQWLAVGGLGVVRGSTGFRQAGRIVPSVGSLSPAMRRDQGLIFVFHTQKPQIKILRGHTGGVVALEFEPSARNGNPVLVSVAEGWDEKAEKQRGEVKAWDLAGERALGDGITIPISKDWSRPDLVALRTGDNIEQLRIAIAWGDGQLRQWDVSAPAGQFQSVEDGKFNNSVVVLNGARQIVLASSVAGNGTAVLQAWDLSRASPQKTSDNIYLEPEPDNGDMIFRYPRAVRLFSSRTGGPQDHAAVAVLATRARMVDGKTKFIEQKLRLEVVSLQGNSFGRRKANILLWNFMGFVPALATSPGGRYLAVAGNNDHRIFIYDVGDLLQNLDKRQVLQSDAQPMHFVGFAEKLVNNQTQMGLLLNDQAKKEGKWLFDITGRKLTNNLDGWKLQTPDWGGWQAPRLDPNDPQVLTIRHAQGQEWRWRFTEGQQITALALTGNSPAKVPLLAVAFFHSKTSEPLLEIFNLKTGAHVRRFVGHLAPIRSLAFSADGRLLASTSDDQTVAVWSLTTLPEILGVYGRLPGLAVKKNEQEQLEVVEFKQDFHAAPEQLRPGDIVLGIEFDGKFKKVTEPSALYEAFWMTKPGDAVTLRVRKAGGERSVRVLAAQGIDERKPLFHLFATRQQKNQLPDWIAWNPIGYFDSSRLAVEKYLGWHFNTGNQEKPASFALIKEYRDRSYKPSLLRHLMEQGTLEQALKALQKEQEAMLLPPPSLRLDLVGQLPRKDGSYLVRDRELKLRLSLDNYKPEKGDRIIWQKYENDQWQTWKTDNADRRVHASFQLPSKSGVYKLRAMVRFPIYKDQLPADYLTVHYQPPAPTIEYKGPTGYITVNDAKFVFKAAVVPGAEGQPIEVTLLKQHTGKDETKAFQGDKRINIEEEFTLKEGFNLITLSARNREVLADHAKQETSTVSVGVNYSPPQVTSVGISVEKIILLPEGKAGDPIIVRPGQPIEVTVPAIRVMGLIKGEENLKTASWDLGEGTQPSQLKNFDRNQKSCVIEEDFFLQPGRQTIRFLAQSPNSKPVIETLTIIYQPELPDVVMMEPAQRTVTTGKVAVEANLLAPRFPSKEPFPVKAAVLLNNKRIKEIDLNSAAQKLTVGEVALEPGENLLELVLTPQWEGISKLAGVATRRATLPLRYIRPPTFSSIEAPKVSKRPYVDLNAIVQSALPLDENSVVVEVNGEPREPAKVTVAKANPIWKLNLHDVPLTEGKNLVRVWISNAEASAQAPGEVEILVKTPPPAPEIAFIGQVEANQAVKTPNIDLRFLVKSASPLQQVRVFNNDKVAFTYTAEQLKAMKPNEQGYYEFAKEFSLIPDTNRIKVEALNSGGPKDAARIINLIGEPVTLEIVRLEMVRPVRKVFEPKQTSTGQITFENIPEGRVRLHGVVRWLDPKNPELDQPHQIQLSVNGFRQLPVHLLPRSGESPERAFQTEIFMSAKENRVDVSLSGLPQDSANRRTFVLNCDNPLKGQHLHLVIIAPGRKDEVQLKNLVLSMLHAKRNPDGTYSNDVFERIDVHPLMDHVKRREVTSHLDNIADIIRERASRGNPNDVLMFYYQGKQTIIGQGTFFHVSDTRAEGDVQTTTLGLKELAEVFSDRSLSGAQVLFLDVAPSSETELAQLRQKVQALKTDRTSVGEWLAGAPFAAVRQTFLGLPDSPQMARLLLALQEQMPQIPELRALLESLRTRFEPMQAGSTSLFDQSVPENLSVQLHR